MQASSESPHYRSDVCVCILAQGDARYAWAARQAVKSVLRHTTFDVFLAIGEGVAIKKTHDPRVQFSRLSSEARSACRARPFLNKFDALRSCLEAGSHRGMMLMDADAIVVQPITTKMFEDALAGCDLGMVEQKGIRGSNMHRKEFLEHYKNHTLMWMDAHAVTPSVQSFRFFNSGIALGKRSLWEDILDWVLNHPAMDNGNHQIGKHIIADQDYLQFWANNLHPERCIELPWIWNHCQHWNENFPNSKALILHFSNFCNGPSLLNIFLMALLHRSSLLTSSIRFLLKKINNCSTISKS